MNCSEDVVLIYIEHLWAKMKTEFEFPVFSV